MLTCYEGAWLNGCTSRSSCCLLKIMSGPIASDRQPYYLHCRHGHRTPAYSRGEFLYMGLRTQVFISYSHDDESWRERLERHLQPLVRGGELRVWVDTKITPGSDWRREIDAAIDSAKVAVLLISGSFLASRFISEVELPKILTRHQREGLVIFWIPVSASNYQDTELEQFQAAYDPRTPLNSLKKSKAEQALVQICQRIKDALSLGGPVELRETPERAFLISTVNSYEQRRREYPRNVQLNILDFLVEARGSATPPTPDSPVAADVKPVWELIRPHLEERKPCFILADFGLGKSWLLQMLQYRLARAKLEERAEADGRWIPFYMKLQTFRRPTIPLSILSFLPFLGGAAPRRPSSPTCATRLGRTPTASPSSTRGAAS